MSEVTPEWLEELAQSAEAGHPFWQSANALRSAADALRAEREKREEAEAELKQFNHESASVPELINENCTQAQEIKRLREALPRLVESAFQEGLDCEEVEAAWANSDSRLEADTLSTTDTYYPTIEEQQALDDALKMSAADTAQQVRKRETDAGQWGAGIDNNDGRVFVESTDFTHDVRLYVDGDFVDRDQRLEYARDIARRLDATKPEPVREREGETEDAVFCSVCGAPIRSGWVSPKPGGLCLCSDCATTEDEAVPPTPED